MSISICTMDEVIACLSSKNFETFNMFDSYAVVYVNDIEIIFETENGAVSDALCEFAVSVLNDMEACIGKAHNWLTHFNLKQDRWSPDALDAGFAVSGIYFGKFGYGNRLHARCDGFAISFDTVNPYACGFTVKFHGNKTPFAVEEWVI